MEIVLILAGIIIIAFIGYSFSCIKKIKILEMEKNLEEENRKKLENELFSLNESLKKYSKLLSLDEEKIRLREENRKKLEEIKDNKERAIILLEKISELEEEISKLEEVSNLQEFAYYKPKYQFEDIEEYKEELAYIKKEQKKMIKDKTAAYCNTEWEVSHSRSKGKAMTNDNLRVMIRCFNGESDAAISKVKYNNVDTMETRIEKSFEMLNKYYKNNDSYINRSYLDLKLKELYLNHEYHQKQQEVKEEQRDIREQMREEESAEREYERAQKQAQKEEDRAQKALEKAKAELGKAHGSKVDKLNEKIKLLEESLEKAKEMGLRATSMAQITKSGHVYVISNIGSFGEEIFKIGMTRRLIPEERVRELGGASVPFKFDVHAMIYSNNAPELENNLHKELENRRVNKVNRRKEFFNVTLEELENISKKYNSEIKFTHITEAEEYRGTLALKNEEENFVPLEDRTLKMKEEILSI